MKEKTICNEKLRELYLIMKENGIETIEELEAYSNPRSKDEVKKEQTQTQEVEK